MKTPFNKFIADCLVGIGLGLAVSFFFFILVASSIGVSTHVLPFRNTSLF